MCPAKITLIDSKVVRMIRMCLRTAYTLLTPLRMASPGLPELQLRCVPLTVHRASLQRAKTDRNIMEHISRYHNIKIIISIIIIYPSYIWVCLKMLCTPLYPMVLLIIIPFFNGYFIGKINPTFSDKPTSWNIMEHIRTAKMVLGWLGCAGHKWKWCNYVLLWLTLYNIGA